MTIVIRFKSGFELPITCEELKAEHIQRAKWLRELQEYKAQPKIIHCCECKFFRANMSPVFAVMEKR